MLARLCFYEPSGEYAGAETLELQPMPKDSGAVYRLTVGPEVGVGWRVIVNGMGSYRVSSLAPAGGRAEALLTRMGSTLSG
jgi:hypothetical protein